MAVGSVGVIGVGRLGSDVAFMLAEGDLCDVVLYDAVAEKASFLASDLSDTSFERVYSRRITWASELRELTRCDVILLAAGNRPDENDTPQDLFRANRPLIREIADAFMGSSTLFVVATEPVDLVTAELARRLHLPHSRVMGIAGVVDSFRVRYAVGQALSVNTDYIRTHVVGPHDERAHILWEYTSINGVPIQSLTSEDRLAKLESSFTEQVKDQFRQHTGNLSRYTPSIACFDLLRVLTRDDRRIMSVTIPWVNVLGISGVAMSVPSVIGRFGAERVVLPELDGGVKNRLRKSADAYASILGEAE